MHKRNECVSPNPTWGQEKQNVHNYTKKKIMILKTNSRRDFKKKKKNKKKNKKMNIQQPCVY